MASVTLEQSVRPWLSRFGLHTAMRVTCVRYRSVLDACMQARHGWQIELMKRPAQRRIFCSFNGGLIGESSPDATESIYVLVEHTDIALMQALRRAPRPLAGVCSIVLTLELHTFGVPEDHLLVYDLSTIVCAKRCVCSSSTCGVS